jgi:hypothetical protein
MLFESLFMGNFLKKQKKAKRMMESCRSENLRDNIMNFRMTFQFIASVGW